MRECLGRAGLEAEQLLVESRRVGFRAELDADVLVHVGAGVRLATRVPPLEIEHDGVAVIDAASFDRLEPRRAIAQPLQRRLHRFVVDRIRRAPERDRREIAGIEWRDRVERRREGQRLAFFDCHVADVGRVDRLEAALAQRLVDGARNQVVRDVVQDLVLEALLDDAGRCLSRPEAGHPRLPGIVPRDAIDLGVDHSVGISTRTVLRVALTSANSVFMVSGAGAGPSTFDLRACGASVDKSAIAVFYQGALRHVPALRSSPRERKASEGVRKGGVEPP